MQKIPRRGMEITPRTRAVTVKQLPPVFNAKQERMFLREIESCLNVSRPCIVLDCSEARQIDRPFLHLLLCCLEEAMKRNGDVRLAALRPDARAILKLAGIQRLFKSYETVAEAVESFQQASECGFRAESGYAEASENAA